MAWCFYGFLLCLSFCTFVTSHVSFVFNMMTQCVYFQLWKAYDMFWLWLLMLITCCVPALRFDNYTLSFLKLWWKVCGKDDQRIRWVLKDQDKEIDDVETRLKKLVNALNFAVDLLRLRISAAILVGNLRLRTRNFKLPPYAAISFIDWDPYKITLGFDLAFLWFMFLFNWWRQFYVCCQLGCCRFYFLIFGVLAVGALIMELPMWYLFNNMDQSWCKFDFKEVAVFNRSLYPNEVFADD